MVNLLSCLLLVLLSLHYFVACLAANTKNITTDQSALLAFKSLITSDPYDMLANNWSTSSSVCSWVGVTCDERHGRVHSLILQNMSLRGIVSPNLGNMSFLVILDLKNNSFSGQFPKELCRLHKLRVLHISYNKFEGGIPAALGDLSQLQYLYLGANNFSGFVPQSIGKLRQLKELDTIQNRLSGPIPQSISNLSSLERIGLSFNYFSAVNTKNITTDQSALLAFKSLITSDPNVCNWVGATCDGRYGRVHSLILRNMSLRGTVSPNLRNLSILVILDLKNNSFSCQFPKELCRLHILKVLRISYNEFEGEIPVTLGDLSRLQYLYLDANNFSGFIPQSIGNLRWLKEY
ncbi:Serine/Threonine kinase, plant-type protein, putative [Medicago truncatula]|uniref:Serine/Threonine kinase, plant-type protein, putative n=1 Tax=Medicago truncatula TaxID=3880 RepID=A0A072TRA1_MEDTR|nr:Serine/Threonine kinase, plant-type protein, putative [Medicago truncatula]